MNNETFVYIADKKKYSFGEIDDISVHEINDWYDQSVLPESAKRFIKYCIDKGEIYSLKGFSVAQNINCDDFKDHLIFISNKF